MKRWPLSAFVVFAIVLGVACTSDPEGAPSQATCGHAGEVCCDGGGCGSKLRCETGTCVAPPSDVGLSCATDAECQEGVCVAIASDEGGERKVCSRSCTTVDECVKGWECTRRGAGRAVCTCAQSSETCDGNDNDCNGVADDGAADDACSAAGAGPHECRSGACSCITECGGSVEGVTRCVDARSDVENCGACGHRCAGAEVCGDGTCICAGGVVCAGVCTDTQNDNRNCGGCGATCEYQCHDGECEPAVLLARDPSLPGKDASNVHRVLALDASSVYFVHSKPGELMLADRPEQIRRCPLIGCTGPAAEEVIPYRHETYIDNLVVDGATLYWWEDIKLLTGMGPGTRISACETAACASTTRTIFESLDRHNPSGDAWTFTVNGGEVFFGGFRSLRSCPATGCLAPPTVLTPATAQKIVADADGVYFTDASVTEDFITRRTPIYGCARTGCSSPTILYEAPGELQDLVAYGGRIYWSSWMSMFETATSYVASCAPSACASSMIVLGNAEDRVTSVAVDAQGAYWTLDALPLGKIRKCVLPGCPGGPTTLADHQHGPGGLVINATNTFWADLDFQLFRFGR